MMQYVQRLAGLLGEAKTHLNNVQNGLRYRLMSETVRKEMETDARNRLADLQDAYQSIADTNVLFRPVAFLRRADDALLADTWRAFVPALPTAAEGTLYVAVAMIAGFLLYELMKFPVTVLLLEPRRRKFRRRG